MAPADPPSSPPKVENSTSFFIFLTFSLEEASREIAKFNESDDSFLLTNELDLLKDSGYRLFEEFTETNHQQQEFYNKIFNIKTRAGWFIQKC